MKVRNRILVQRSFFIATFACLLSILIPTNCSYGQPKETEIPKVLLMQAGADRLLADLELMVKTIAGQSKTWSDKVEPNIVIFLDGINRTKPIRIDILLKPDGEEYSPHFPISNKKQFRKNLETVGIDSKRAARNLYELKNLIEGYLRFHHGYGSIAEEKKQIPSKMEDPRIAISVYEKEGYDVAAKITNSAEGIEKRRSSFVPVIQNLLAGTKKLKNETPEEFDLRKLAAEQQLNELERFFVESKLVEGNWTTDNLTKTAYGELMLEALPGTDLEKSIILANKEPSYFSAIPFNEKASTALQVNFPLDDFRKKQLLHFYKVFIPVLKSRISRDKSLSPEGLVAGQKAVEILIGLLAEGTQLSSIDAHLEMVPDGEGRFTLVSGIRAVDGNKAIEFVKLIPQFEPAVRLKMNIEKVHGVDLHVIEFVNPGPPAIVYLFGEKAKIYIGTSKDAVWTGVGKSGKEALIKRITEVVTSKGKIKKKEGAPFYRVSTQLLHLMQALDLELGKKGDPDQRKAILEGLKEGDGRINAELRADGKIVRGKADADTGVLRMLGRIIAYQAEENF